MKTYYILLLTFFSFFCGNAQETWQEATRIADSLNYSFKNTEALSLREKAIQLAKQQQPDTIPFLEILKTQTEAELEFNSDIDKKVTYKKLEDAIKALESKNAPPERMYQLYRKMYIYAYNFMRDMPSAELYANKSIETNRKNIKIDSSKLLLAMHTSGVIQRQMGDLDKSLKTLKECIVINESNIDGLGNMLGTLYNELASTYNANYLNIPHKFHYYLKKSDSVFSSTNPSLEYYQSTLPSLSDYETSRGNYTEALGYLNKGFQLFVENKESSQFNKMGNLGLKSELQYCRKLLGIYAKMGDEKGIQEALDKLHGYAKLKKLDATENRMIAIAYLHAGNFYTKRENYKLSKSYYKKGLVAANLSLQFSVLPDLYNALAALELINNNPQEALRILNADEHFENTITDVKIEYFKNYVDAYLAINQPEKAVINLNLLLNEMDDGDNDLDIQTLNPVNYKPGYVFKYIYPLIDLANALENESDLFKGYALKLYTVALKHFEANFKEGELNPESKKYLEQITSGLFRTNPNPSQEELKNFIETNEAITTRFLFTKYNQNRVVSNDSLTNALIDKEQLIRANITFIKKQILQDTSQVLKQKLFDEKLLLNNTETALVQNNKKIAKLYNFEFDLANLDTKNNNYIKFIVADNNLYRFVISEENIDFKTIENFNDISEKTKEFLNQIRDTNANVSSLKNNSTALYNALLSNISWEKKNNIIPDKILNYLPFELLVNKDEYLLANNDISYAIGLSYLQNTDKVISSKKETSVALFAPSYSKFQPTEVQLAVRGEAYDLSGAKAEVNEISQIIPSQVFMDGAASKKAFQNLNKDVSIIHLSMHSFLNDADPELSSLVFSDDEEENELYISELYGLNLNADLAVLSACNTGIGGFNEGDGLVSMSRAFTFAGVPATVSSLWSAPDLSTKKIMVSFYEHLKEGETKSKALQLAKLDYLNSTTEPALKHPYYWAGFVLHGNDAPIALQGGSNLWVWILLGILGVGIILFFTSRKRKTV